MTLQLMASLSVAAAVWLAFKPPVGMARVRERKSHDLPRWLAGRPGAMPIKRRILVALVMGVAVFAFLPGVGGFLLAMISAPITTIALGHLEPASLRRDRAELAAQQPIVLELLAASLAAGAAPARATSDVAAVSPPASRAVLELVASHIRVGRSEALAWQELAAHESWAEVWGPVARDFSRAITSGAAAQQVLRTHATQARLAHRDLVERQAKKVAVRATMPLMCCYLPAFLLVGIVPIVVGTFTNTFGG